MARIGVCYSLSFSSDGARIDFNSDLGGIPQVWTVATEGGWPQPVTALDEPVHFLHWSPDGSAIAFTVAPGGGMNEQVYTVRPDGTGLRRLTDGGKETNRLGRWTHDGTALMLASKRLSLRRPPHPRRPGVMPCDDRRFVSSRHCCSACWSHTH